MGIFSRLFGKPRQDASDAYLEKMLRFRAQMPSLARMRPISHVLIFDTEPAAYVGDVLENAAATYRLFCELVSEPLGSMKYSIICTFPEERTDLHELIRRHEVRMKAEDIPFAVNSVKRSERTLNGKEGLRACTEWLLPLSSIKITDTDALTHAKAMDVLVSTAP